MGISSPVHCRIIAQLFILLGLFLGLGISGCSTLGYYRQAILGQISLLSKREPIEKAIESGELTGDTIAKLRLVLEVRQFAETELGFPVGESYSSYVETGRPYVVWNLIVAPEFSLDPLEFCFPIAGCVTYRGYFNRSMAIKEADRYKSRGYDVFIGGVKAYSTLGWFDDPVLDTFLRGPDLDLVALLFHETAHQLVYAPGDTTFNESFASTVEFEAVRRWLLAQGTAAGFERYQASKDRQSQFVEWLGGKKQKLEDIYQSVLEDDEKRRLKQQLIDELRTDYGRLQQRWGDQDDFSAWVNAEINNAKLSSIAAYHDLVPYFKGLLREEKGDLTAFIERARILSDLSYEDRVSETGRRPLTTESTNTR